MGAALRPIRPLLAPAGSRDAYSLDILLPEIRGVRPGGVVAILGAPRSGKTTTLRLIRETVARPNLVLLDEPSNRQVLRAATGAGVIYSAETEVELPFAHHAVLRLQPWGPDQIVEWLLLHRKDACARVMAALTNIGDDERLDPWPELWCVALREMVNHPELPGPLAALRKVMLGRRRGNAKLRATYPLCDAIVAAHEFTRTAIAGESGSTLVVPSAYLLRELVSHVANRKFLEALENIIADPSCPSHALPVSILHLARINWRPHVGAKINIDKAFVPGLSWPGVTLGRLDARAANLQGADLSASAIATADFQAATLAGASLRSLRVGNARFSRASLVRADLAGCVAHHADFQDADLSSCNAEDADLAHATFARADLSHARLVRADLGNAHLRNSRLEGTDLASANLANARLNSLDLRTANLHGVRMAGIEMTDCRLDAVTAEALDLHHSVLRRCDLSASVFRNALIENVGILACGLADVDWEGANLRNTDFSRSSFHAGSSRSGLVFSPIACEGSRTGFYTDEGSELTHKAPELIRKANLCACDLRGAKVDRTDFYLVDLRHARYDTHQAEWFKRCGAILFDPRR